MGEKYRRDDISLSDAREVTTGKIIRNSSYLFRS